MKKQFVGHFKRTDSEIADIWQKATFVFDANILLNLYRYSDDTRLEFLELLESIKVRVWLPEQAAYEYFKNRPSVICEQIKAYKDNVLKLQKLNELDNLFSSKRAHPFISKQAKEKYDSAVEDIRKEMSEKQKQQESLLNDDHIKEKIAGIFETRVGKPYSEKELENIFVDGTKRFSEKTPPGYMDFEKFKDSEHNLEKRANCGDLIIWKQVMDLSKAERSPIVFVTDDQKEDWWIKASGKTLGPRPELIQEFLEETDQQILIYKPELFLNLAKKQLHQKISSKSIEEITSERASRLKNIDLAENIRKDLANKKIISDFKADAAAYYRKRNKHHHSSQEIDNNGSLLEIESKIRTLQTTLTKLNSTIKNLHTEISEAFEVRDKELMDLLEQDLFTTRLRKNDVETELNRLQYYYSRLESDLS